MKRPIEPGSDEASRVNEAVHMILYSLSGAVIQRETAVRVLLDDDHDDIDSAMLTASTMWLGLLLAYFSKGDERIYNQGVGKMTRILMHDKETIFRMSYDMLKNWELARGYRGKKPQA
jgi:hypothetical protein